MGINPSSWLGWYNELLRFKNTEQSEMLPNYDKAALPPGHFAPAST